jgi:hypothetical protein
LLTPTYAAVCAALGKAPSETVYMDDVIGTGFTTLDAADAGITDLSGLEYCRDLSWVDLSGNPIMDITPLWLLPSLWSINLNGTAISTIAPLFGLNHLRHLHLNDTNLSGCIRDRLRNFPLKLAWNFPSSLFRRVPREDAFGGYIRLWPILARRTRSSSQSQWRSSGRLAMHLQKILKTMKLEPTMRVVGCSTQALRPDSDGLSFQIQMTMYKQ